MEEVLGLLASDGPKYTHVHLKRAFGVEEHYLFIGLSKGEAQSGRVGLSHGALERQVAAFVIRNIAPVSACGARNYDDGLLTVRLKSPEHIC